MATSIGILRVRAALVAATGGGWSRPVEFGPDGWSMVRPPQSVIISCAEHDGVEYLHASIAGDELPSYAELVALHRAVFDSGYAYQVFAPPAQHVNIHECALHLWGRLDGRPVLPEFGAGGSI